MDIDKKDPKLLPDDTLKFSFTITYILLITTGTITLVEALRATDPLVRHVLNLETVISIIAGFFYSKFVEKVSDKEYEIDWQDLIKTRYTDWFITTPLMLLALILALSQNLKTKPSILVYLFVVLMNFMMLLLGYLGEIGSISRNLGLYGGFVPFFIMFGTIFYNFVYEKGIMFNTILFWIYSVVWSVYGLVYNRKEREKNITYNTLDFIAKCFIGLSLWLYFINVFSL